VALGRLEHRRAQAQTALVKAGTGDPAVIDVDDHRAGVGGEGLGEAVPRIPGGEVGVDEHPHVGGADRARRAASRRHRLQRLWP
jgi:hypothetical protein